MCGFAGVVHPGRPGSDSYVHRMAPGLRHRGPDQSGSYTAHGISLATARLSIFDLADGAQPLHSSDGDLVVGYNGEIYNFLEVRRDLEALGHRFRTRCDTEVILNGYLAWGKDCFRRFRGMFAVAIWHQRQQRLLLVRDRMGIKPLYVLERGRSLYFASELKGILAHPEVERELDLDGLSSYLSLNWVPGPHTLIQGVRKLPQGTWLEWSAGRSETGAYWEPSYTVRPRTSQEAVEELDGLLRAAVREQLAADVPVGVWASGGIDSTTVLHYAAELCPSQVKTFSVTFRGRSFDESRWIREAAQRYGTDHHELDLGGAPDLADVVDALAWHADEPNADAGAVPLWYLSRMTRKAVTVVLSGEGSDELFGGYQTYRADRYAEWARLTPAFLRRAALRLAHRLPASDEKIGFDYKLQRFLGGSLLPADRAHLYWNGMFDEPGKARLLAEGRLRPFPDLMSTLPAEARRLPNPERYLRLDQRFYLADNILVKCDRVSMAHSLEVRPPFLDERIVAFAASLPPHLKIRGSRLKWILYQTMAGKLPPSVLSRRKEGFDIPVHDWFRGPMRQLLNDTVNEQANRRHALFLWPELQRLIATHMSRKINAGYHLWGLLMLFRWMDTWKVQVPAPAEEPLSRARVTA
ncbi:MAG TPA: asparagine synthase (glutamine-hydrolyzing) [Solibacterales bacterium]|nr:asparagine synthase (glutamine-hydrolyzing) [Bryobacterales bacterium]